MGSRARPNRSGDPRESNCDEGMTPHREYLVAHRTHQHYARAIGNRRSGNSLNAACARHGLTVNGECRVQSSGSTNTSSATIRIRDIKGLRQASDKRFGDSMSDSTGFPGISGLDIQSHPISPGPTATPCLIATGDAAVLQRQGTCVSAVSSVCSISTAVPDVVPRTVPPIAIRSRLSTQRERMRQERFKVERFDG